MMSGIWRWKWSLDGAVLDGRTHSVLWPGFEAIVATLLQRALHDVHFKEVPHFLSEKYFFLDLHGVAQVCMLLNLAASLQSGLVEHVVVTHEGLHHRLEQTAVEHQCWSMHKPHFNHHYKHHPSSPQKLPFSTIAHNLDTVGAILSDYAANWKRRGGA